MLNKEQFEKILKVLNVEKKIKEEVEQRKIQEKIATSITLISFVIMNLMFNTTLNKDTIILMSFLFLISAVLTWIILFIISFSRSLYFKKKVKDFKNYTILSFDNAIFNVTLKDYKKVEELRKDLNTEQLTFILNLYKKDLTIGEALYQYLENQVKTNKSDIIESKKEDLVDIVTSLFVSEKVIIKLLALIEEKINNQLNKDIIDLKEKILKKKDIVINIENE